ncbi:MAG: hypothetical protein QOJ73_3855 [Streptosporangiaceae bacterium]|nr:hypothetical protein [Streptosporangiaceae bacterium]
MLADPETTERSARPRIDENVLGAGTTPRFLLLLALIVTSGGTMIETMHGWWTGQADDLYDCFLAAGWDSDRGYGINVTVMMGANHDALMACLARFALPWWLIPALALPPLVLAAALYWWLPAWKGRASRVVPVARLDPTGDLRATLADLVVVAGLRRAPRFVIDPAGAATSAVVFGRPGRYTVCLHGGLIARRAADPDGFRAVVLHELAHIRNGDAGITYATVALWRGLLAVLVPYLIWSGTQLYRGLSQPATDATVQQIGYDLTLLLTVVLGYLTRADLLRSREIHADLAAVSWGATTGIWGHTGTPAGDGRLRAAVASFTELWRTHPRWNRRRESLTDPAALFGLQPLPTFLTGVTTALVANERELPGASWWAAGLAGAVVGIALWRAVAYAVPGGRRVPSGLATGWWLGLGFLAAQLVGSDVSDFQWAIAQPALLLVVVLLGVLTAGWTAGCARLWATTLDRRSGRPMVVVTLGGLVLVLAAGLDWWHNTGALYAQDWSMPGNLADSWTRLRAPQLAGPAEDLVRTAMRIAVLGWFWGPPVVWAGTALWLIPLLGWVLPSRAALPPLSRVARDGLLGAVMSWCVTAAALAYLHASLMPRVPPGAPALQLAEAFLIVTLVIGPALIAAVAAAQASAHRLVVAVVPAGIAALLGGAGAQALIAADGCVRPLALIDTQCRWHRELASRWADYPSVAPTLLGAGLVTSALVATLVSGLATRRRARSPEGPPTPRQTPPRVPGVRRRFGRVAAPGAVAALCAVTLVLVVAIQPPPTGPAHGALEGVAYPTGPARSPDVWGAQLAAWDRLGGHDLLTRLISLVDAVETSPIRRAETPIDDPSPAGRAAAEQLRRACTGLTTLADDSTQYFPIPDPDAEQTWSRVMRQVGRAGADCRRALDQRDPALLDSSGGAVVDAANQVTSMLNGLARRLQSTS